MFVFTRIWKEMKLDFWGKKYTIDFYNREKVWAVQVGTVHRSWTADKAGFYLFSLHVSLFVLVALLKYIFINSWVCNGKIFTYRLTLLDIYWAKACKSSDVNSIQTWSKAPLISLVDTGMKENYDKCVSTSRKDNFNSSKKFWLEAELILG